MTILTKPTFVAKPSTGGDAAAAVESGAILHPEDNETNDKLFLLQTRARRMFSFSTVLLILATVCLICMGILTGIVIYRRSQMQQMRFHGFCGVPYNSDFDDGFDDNRELLNMLNEKFREFANAMDNLSNAERLQSMLNDDNNSSEKDIGFFKEEFDLDLSPEGESAKINVPDFRDGRTGRFLHDFRSNQTAIIDESNKRCFVMPLDREAVLPPASLADLIQKMYSGYYDINPKVIQKKMRVVTPALDDLSSVSPKIQEACDSMSVYRLEKYVGGVFKRSAELSSSQKFAEFNGHYVYYDFV